MKTWVQVSLIALGLGLLFIPLANQKFKEDVAEQAITLSELVFVLPPEPEPEPVVFVGPPEPPLPLKLECATHPMRPFSISCRSTRPGYFQWYYQNDGLGLYFAYANSVPVLSTYVNFPTDPGEVLVRFEDERGNKIAINYAVKPEYIMCHPLNKCERV